MPIPLPRRLVTFALCLALSACASHGPRQEAAPDVAVAASPSPAPAAPQTDAVADAGHAGDATPSQVAPPAATAGNAIPPPPGTVDAGIDSTTQAEDDYAAIYGAGDAQATTALPPGRDPWERWNRRVHAFNNAVDVHVAKPLARAYVKVVPRPVRSGITNFFNNLSQPVSALNSLLQGKPHQAAASVARFLLNSTVGVAGFFDPATRWDVPNYSEDFGQTLGVWGWDRSRYLELPFLGPRTVRDAVGFVADAPLSPLQQVHDTPVRVGLQGLQLVDMRTQLMAADSMKEGAVDEYALYRDGWLQRRQHQIFGDREDGQLQLPDYLREAQPAPRR